jgi:hypothetical protein
VLRRNLFFPALLALGAALLPTAGANAAIPDASCPFPPAGNNAVGRSTQTFTALRTGGIVSGQMFLNKNVGPDFVIDIYRADASGPTGNPIATSAPITDASIPNGVETPVTGSFPSPAPVIAGGSYAISLHRAGGFFIARDLSGDVCPGNEFSFADPSWIMINPEHDHPFYTTIEPSNAVSGVSQDGRTLKVSVPNDGVVSIAPQAAKKAKVKSAQTPAASAGTVSLPLSLTKSGKKALRERDKVKSTLTVTFAPTGGSPGSVPVKVKIKPAKKKKKKN